MVGILGQGSIWSTSSPICDWNLVNRINLKGYRVGRWNFGTGVHLIHIFPICDCNFDNKINLKGHRIGQWNFGRRVHLIHIFSYMWLAFWNGIKHHKIETIYRVGRWHLKWPIWSKTLPNGDQSFEQDNQEFQLKDFNECFKAVSIQSPLHLELCHTLQFFDIVHVELNHDKVQVLILPWEFRVRNCP